MKEPLKKWCARVPNRPCWKESSLWREPKGCSRLCGQAGLEPEDDSLVIRREISSAGRNRVFINNGLSTLALLKTIGDQLVDIHGQHDHQSLLDVGRHLSLLDEYGAHNSMVQEIGDRHRRMQTIARQLESGRIDEQERLKRIDILQYQLAEIRRAGLRAEEREELENEKGILANREKIFGLTSELYDLVYEGEQSMLAHLNRVARLLQELESLDSAWSRASGSDFGEPLPTGRPCLLHARLYVRARLQLRPAGAGGAEVV